MKKKRKYMLIGIIVLFVFICIYIGYASINRVNNSVGFLDAVRHVYGRDIKGTALVIDRTSDLYFSKTENYYAAAGNKDNNFSDDSKDGVRLWAANQLLLSLAELPSKTISKESAGELLKSNSDLFFIQTNYDFLDKRNEIRYLYVFVNATNYKIYIPQEYCAPNKLVDYADNYFEYEPNEIIKTLIKLILET